MTYFRALLVGLGQIGCGYDAALSFVRDEPRSSERTLTHARALACHPGFSIEAGIDQSPVARQRFTELYDVPAYSDLSGWMASSPNPFLDLVVVAVPTHLQLELVLNLLNFTQPRILLLEKPLAFCLQHAEAIKQICDQYPNMSVAVNYIRRWLPSVQDWHRRLKAGELGRFLHGNMTYGKGLLSNGCHFVNLAQAWLGPLTLGRVLDYGEPFQDFDREVSFELLVENHHKAPLQVRSIGNSGMRAAELDLWFERGRLCWPNHGREINFWPRCGSVSWDTHDHLASEPKLFPTGLEHYQLEVVNSLYKHLASPNDFLIDCDLNDGLQTLKTLTSSMK